MDFSPLVDREREQKALRALLLRPGPTMAVLYGRRLSLHGKHIDMLKRLASSGYDWAREALAPGAVLVYVAAGGFVPHFLERAEVEGVRVIAWSLDDLYSDPVQG